MKLFLFLILCSQCLSQEFLIQKTDGTKIQIKPNYFRVDDSEKCVFYKSLTKDSELKINYKDLDFAEIGINKFKTFKLDNAREALGFFILSESADKFLISITKQDSAEESTIVNYVFHIIDKESKIIESYAFNDSKNSKNANLRADIFAKIRYYFPDCEALIIRLTRFDKNASQNNYTSILGFFNAPVYIKCE